MAENQQMQLATYLVYVIHTPNNTPAYNYVYS